MGSVRQQRDRDSTRSPLGEESDMRTVELLLERLEGVLEHNGFHRAFCPAHDDRNTPNLDIKEGDEGQALVICRAGCKTHEVVGALGLEMGDLFLLSPKGRRNGHK